MAGSLDVEALELFDPAPEDPTVHGLAAAVIAAARKFNQPIALVAHGTAVPVAWRAAQALQPAALVLSDGPVSRLDGVLGGLCQLARSPWLFSKTVLQPDFLTRWLASSAGLRRAVVNPYVATPLSRFWHPCSGALSTAWPSHVSCEACLRLWFRPPHMRVGRCCAGGMRTRSMGQK